jgi:hypothetical protein
MDPSAKSESSIVDVITPGGTDIYSTMDSKYHEAPSSDEYYQHRWVPEFFQLSLGVFAHAVVSPTHPKAGTEGIDIGNLFYKNLEIQLVDDRYMTSWPQYQRPTCDDQFNAYIHEGGAHEGTSWFRVEADGLSWLEKRYMAEHRVTAPPIFYLREHGPSHLALEPGQKEYHRYKGIINLSNLYRVARQYNLFPGQCSVWNDATIRDNYTGHAGYEGEDHLTINGSSVFEEAFLITEMRGLLNQKVETYRFNVCAVPAGTRMCD